MRLIGIEIESEEKEEKTPMGIWRRIKDRSREDGGRKSREVERPGDRKRDK